HRILEFSLSRQASQESDRRIVGSRSRKFARQLGESLEHRSGGRKADPRHATSFDNVRRKRPSAISVPHDRNAAYTGITTGTIPLMRTMPLRLISGAVRVIVAPAV